MLWWGWVITGEWGVHVLRVVAFVRVGMGVGVTWVCGGMVGVACALMGAKGAVLVWEPERSCNLFLILLVEVKLDWWKVNCLGLAPPCSEGLGRFSLSCSFSWAATSMPVLLYPHRT